MRSSENSKDNPSNHMLFFVFALLVLASKPLLLLTCTYEVICSTNQMTIALLGGLQAQYVVEDADGCVDIAVEVPAPFTVNITFQFQVNLGY